MLHIMTEYRITITCRLRLTCSYKSNVSPALMKFSVSEMLFSSGAGANTKINHVINMRKCMVQ